MSNRIPITSSRIRRLPDEAGPVTSASLATGRVLLMVSSCDLSEVKETGLQSRSLAIH